MSILNNLDIENMALKCKIPLIGVFSKDELPKKKYDGFYIINMQDSEDKYGNPLPGTHWTAFFKWKGQSIYFDSFGIVPPKSVNNFLPKPIMYNSQQIQAIESTCCGWFAVYFGHYLFNNGINEIGFNNFIKMFNEINLKKNDKVIERYAKKALKF